MIEHVVTPLLCGGLGLLLECAAARAPVWAPVVACVRRLVERDRSVAALGLCAGSLSAVSIAIAAFAWGAAAVLVKVLGL